MAKKKGRQISFDTMIKFFMQQYSIPTKADVDKIMKRLDRLESVIQSIVTGQHARGAASAQAGGGKGGGKTKFTSLDVVMDVITGFDKGARVSDIQAATGFDEKKIRNIIYRLNRAGKIKRVTRGAYGAK